MFQSLLRKSFRAQLIVPVALTLLVMIGSGIAFTVIKQKQTSEALNAEIEHSFTEVARSIEGSLGELSARFDADLKTMQSEVAASLAKSSTKTLKRASSSMRMNLQRLSKQGGTNLVDLLSVSSVNSVLAKDYAALNSYVRSAHQNTDVVFLFYRDGDGKPLTRYLNRQNSILKSYLPKGRPDVDQIIQKGDLDDNVLVLTKAIMSEGEVVGSVTLGLDMTGTIQQTQKINEQFDALVEDNSERIDSLLGEESSKLQATLHGVIQTIDERLQERSVETVSAVQKTGESLSKRTKNIFIAGSVLGLILVLFILFMNARSIVKLLGGEPRSMVELARSVAEGDLSMDAKGPAAPGSLLEALGDMSSQLRGFIKSIVVQGKSLRVTSTELALAAEDLTNGADQSARRADAVATATGQMSSSMGQVTESTEQAAQNVNIVSIAMEEMAEAGQKIARNTAKASSMTEEAVQYASGSSEKVNLLGSAAREISKVTEVITEISEQTNLLALNATIEAARAGDAGKGFAVVANEIKELAKQTSDATGEIKAKIESIQSSTDDTVDEIAKISEVINNVNELVATIAAAAEQQSVTVSDVSQNVAEAASGINTVNENVIQASIVAGEIAKDIATVSQVSTEAKEGSLRLQESSKELQKVADSINSDTSRFNVGELLEEGAGKMMEGGSRTLIRWSKGLSVGIDSVDEQHRKLVDMINDLYQKSRSGQQGQVVAHTLNRLVEYTKKHFVYEEQLFDDHGYPQAANHKDVHARLGQQLGEIQEGFKTGEKDVSAELMEFLKDWLLNHIKKTDMAYSSFLIDKGVQ